MNLDTLNDRLAALQNDPGDFRLLGGIAADFATEALSPDAARMGRFRELVAPVVDGMALSNDYPRTHAHGMLTGLMIVAGVLERKLTR